MNQLTVLCILIARYNVVSFYMHADKRPDQSSEITLTISDRLSI